MLQKIKNWFQYHALKFRVLHVVVLDGPQPGEVSFTINNINRGVNVKTPQGFKVLANDQYVYQLMMNGLLAMGLRVRILHKNCAEKPCELCLLSKELEQLIGDLSKKYLEQRKMMNAAFASSGPKAGEVQPIVLKPEKIIVP